MRKLGMKVGVVREAVVGQKMVLYSIEKMQ